VPQRSKGETTTTTTPLFDAVKKHIWGYYQGEDPRPVRPPDDDIVNRCVAALHGHNIEELSRFLHQLFREGATPNRPSGPKRYSWFPRVIQNHFGH
jgi:hypothetical protein